MNVEHVMLLIGGSVVALIIARVVFGTQGERAQRIAARTNQDEDWEFGDEWKNAPAEGPVDLSGWKELISMTENYSRMYDHLIPAMKRESLNLNFVQNLLSENQIASRIIPAAEASLIPADSLYVEEKNFNHAQEILAREKIHTHA